MERIVFLKDLEEPGHTKRDVKGVLSGGGAGGECT